MSESLSLLDQALEAAQEELQLLKDGQYDEAGAKAHERGRLVDEAWHKRDAPAVLHKDKLVELWELQEELTNESRRLMEAIRTDLQMTSKQKTRMTGYGKTLRPKQAHGKFLGKRG